MGPLAGYRIVESAGLGPTPFAGMMLSDMGAEVLRIDKVESGSNFTCSSRQQYYSDFGGFEPRT